MTIVGQKPHARLSRLSERDGFIITGRVDSVQPFLQRSRVVIMPFRVGGGTRLKLIEAMASARPIVSTTIGAEGFAVQSGRQLLLADDPAEFAQSVLRLLGDEVLRSRIGQQARRFAAQYDWRQVAPRFAQVYSQMLSADPKNSR